MKKEDYWKTPAAWRAVVRDGKIALWQVRLLGSGGCHHRLPDRDLYFVGSFAPCP